MGWAFNIRQDPFESYGQTPGPRATQTQSHTYVQYQITDLLAEHFKSLLGYPPAQAGTSLSFDEMMARIPKHAQ
jgi:hypothetical protein